ncbi:MAG: hypothetical protein AB7U38_13585 [Hyphomicrobiales bacterium]
MKHDIKAIADRSLSADRRTVTLTLRDAGGDAVTLTMSHTLANQLRDSINALNDEAMAAQVPHAEGMRAAAFRRCNTANVNVDATWSTVLLEFDPGTPLRVGIAYSLDDADALADAISGMVGRARSLGGSQTRQ